MTSDQIKLIKATIPILREHGVLLTSHFYSRMFTHNPELKHIFNLGNQQNKKQQTALAMAVLAYAEHIETPEVLLPVVDHIGHKHTSLDIRPEHYAIVGRHLIASIGEVLGEGATPELLQAWTLAYGQLASLMSGHEQKLYARQTEKQGGWTGWRPFVVKQKIQESTEITSFYLYPTDGGQVADFQPGQYISLRLFLPELDLLQPRQYSISCAPNDHYYRISVKKEAGTTHPDGMISNRLHAHIEEGDIIELSAPAGVFVLNENTTNKKIFISGGIGQTPLLSMLETLISSPLRTREVVWIHGCRSEQVHAFRDRIAEITAQHENIKQFFFYDEVSQPTAAIQQGWVDLATIKQEVLDPQAEYYICGPVGFIQKHRDYLIAEGVTANQIHFEEFGPASIPLS